MVLPEHVAERIRSLVASTPSSGGHVDNEAAKYGGIAVMGTVGATWLLRPDGSLWEVDDEHWPRIEGPRLRRLASSTHRRPTLYAETPVSAVTLPATGELPGLAYELSGHQRAVRGDRRDRQGRTWPARARWPRARNQRGEQEDGPRVAHRDSLPGFRPREAARVRRRSPAKSIRGTHNLRSTAMRRSTGSGTVASCPRCRSGRRHLRRLPPGRGRPG